MKQPIMRATVFLFREEVGVFAKALAAGANYTRLELNPNVGCDGALFYESRPPVSPKWVGFVQPIVQSGVIEAHTSSSAAVLLIVCNGRVFAVTFGYGRSLINLDLIEPQFGLRVVLNSADPTQLRSLDTKNFEDMVVSTRRQASVSTSLPTFGVDVSRDMLRAVTAQPKDRNFAKQLAGADALVITASMTVLDLVGKCRASLDLFDSEAYKGSFGWVDNLRVVKDAAMLLQLDALLLAELRGATLGTTHLAPPEPIDWDEVDDFSIRMSPTRSARYDDLDLPKYLDHLGARRSTVTKENLTQWRVGLSFSRQGGGEHEYRWPLYKCLVSEQTIDGSRFALIEGQWLEIDATLVAEVNAYLETLDSSTTTLPAGGAKEIERDYNVRAAGALAGVALVLDAKIERPGGASSGIEACDLLTKDREFIHVKRRSHSSTLSHLFAQGNVSAVALSEDPIFRRRLRDLILETAGSEEAAEAWLGAVPEPFSVEEAQRTTVSYFVIADSEKEGLTWLPFFSALNLMLRTRDLRRSGFRVTVNRVGLEGGGVATSTGSVTGESP